MKKQLDGNMLWRRLQNEKNNNKGNQVGTKNKRKNLTSDEKVEAMIKAGLI